MRPGSGHRRDADKYLLRKNEVDPNRVAVIGVGHMETELLALWQETRKTVLFVTHDLEEAIALADRVVVLSAGPARVKGDYEVDLPRPRDVAEVRLNPEFTTLYKRIWADLREEVRRQYEASHA